MQSTSSVSQKDCDVQSSYSNYSAPFSTRLNTWFTNPTKRDTARKNLLFLDDYTKKN